MNKKKAISLAVSLLLLLSILSACSSRGRIPDNNAQNGTVTDSSAEPMPDMSDISGKMSEGAENFTDDVSEKLDDITDSLTMNSDVSSELTGTSALEQATGAVNTTAPDFSPLNETERIILGDNTGTKNTLTGFEKLAAVHYEASDPENSRGLSTEKICHSHGPASGGEAHFTVKEFQKHFDKYDALTLDTVSTEKRLYLTFDCGYENNNLTSKILDILSEKRVPAAFFCTLHHIKSQPELITRMIKEGHIVGNHSDTHPSFPDISRSEMAKEIENCDNFLRSEYGYSAKFFRFPAGEYSDSALDLVRSLGFTSVFWSVAYSDWDINNPHGRDYAVKTVMERLHPGAVILLHAVSQDNADALGEIIDRARSEGYEFYSLDKWKA